MIELSSDKSRLLKTEGHILALGGPGSGKTFIALLKAAAVIKTGTLQPSQYVLFLSFARATIARVAQQAGKLISNSERRGLEINTYHGFAWKILQSHAYLLSSAQTIRLLPPPEAASRLADIDKEGRALEKRRLFENEGLLHFDVFAPICCELLSRSNALARILSDAYPIIILDEFQDTNEDEWNMIQALGKRSTLIALADAEQRIYEFRGADPKRIGEFVTRYSPCQFDFGLENNRSNGTDIVAFGNDLISGANKGRTYDDVTVSTYQVRKGVGIHLDLKLAIMKQCRQLRSLGISDWSLALLVPTKKLMIDVSDYLGGEQQFATGKGLPRFPHDVALDTEGPALAAVMIAGLLEGGPSPESIVRQLIHDLTQHMRGRKGSVAPSTSQLELTDKLRGYLETGIIRGPKRKALVTECLQIAETRMVMQFSGDVAEDWLSIRRELESASADVLRQAAKDAKFLRLLHRGATLRSRLGETWRKTGSYVGAIAAARDALLQEHFSASTRVSRGVHVMTMHKSKGKEFDEVIIYEGSHQGRIVSDTASARETAQACLALRVAVTRAMRHTTILSPKHNVCRFL